MISQFTTAAPPCSLMASNLRSQATTHDQNKLVWDAVNGAVNYTVQYKRNSDVNWITSTTSGNYVHLAGLDQETLYDFRVRSTVLQVMEFTRVQRNFTLIQHSANLME